MTNRLRVLHVITGLRTGGAEMMLSRIVTHLSSSGYDMRVLTLVDGGSLVDTLRAHGIPVSSLRMRFRLPGPVTFWRLRRELRAARPDVVHGWLAHGNLVATIGARLFAREVPFAWNVRQALYDVRYEPRLTQVVIRICARLSHLAARIVYNSGIAAAQHEAAGFDPRRTVVIANGFDTNRFRPDAEAPARLRADLGVPSGAPLIGLVARLHPMKDHPTFLEAARLMVQAGSPAHFILAGQGVDAGAAVFQPALADPLLAGRIHLVGERTDTEFLFAAFDIAALTSYTEAFPNVIGEAMACATPCVTTDVGEAARIVGDTGFVVPARDPQALAAACVRLLSLPIAERHALGDRARHRIEREFALEAVAGRYGQLYEELAG